MPQVQREQRESENVEAWRDYDAALEPWDQYVLIKFTTNPDGQKGNIFRVTIGRDEFKELAQAMSRSQRGDQSIRCRDASSTGNPESLSKSRGLESLDEVAFKFWRPLFISN